MYCKNCGSQINDNANVCGYCGTPVHTQNGFSNNQQQNNTASGQQVYGEPTPSYSGSTQNTNYQNFGQNMNQGYNGQQYQNNGYPNQNQGYGAPQPSNMDGRSTGFAIASMILGIVAILMMCCVPSFWLKTIVAVLGLVFGIISLQNKNNAGRGMAIAGIICSGIAMVVYVIGLVFGTLVLSTLFSLY